MKGILGKKIGMTQVFDAEGVVTPVTVIQAGPMVVTQVKTEETDGYDAVQVGYTEKKDKHTTKALKGHFAKANTSPKKVVREFLNLEKEAFELGQELTVSVFEENDHVDVIGISKGKGTQGAVKRWNYSRGPESHGSKSHRVAGARAAGSYPARVFPGRKGSGKMGHERVTVRNLTVVRVDAEQHYLLVKGAVPGPKGGLVMVKQTTKKTK